MDYPLLRCLLPEENQSQLETGAGSLEEDSQQPLNEEDINEQPIQALLPQESELLNFETIFGSSRTRPDQTDLSLPLYQVCIYLFLVILLTPSGIHKDPKKIDH